MEAIRIELDSRQRQEAIRRLRAMGWSHYRIASAFGISLTEVRRVVDPKLRSADGCTDERWRCTDRRWVA